MITWALPKVFPECRTRGQPWASLIQRQTKWTCSVGFQNFKFDIVLNVKLISLNVGRFSNPVKWTKTLATYGVGCQSQIVLLLNPLESVLAPLCLCLLRAQIIMQPFWVGCARAKHLHTCKRPWFHSQCHGHRLVGAKGEILVPGKHWVTPEPCGIGVGSWSAVTVFISFFLTDSEEQFLACPVHGADLPPDHGIL